MLKRMISVLLCVGMVVSMMPAQAFATEVVDMEITEQLQETESVEETTVSSEGDAIPTEEEINPTEETMDTEESATEPTVGAVPTENTVANEPEVVPIESVIISQADGMKGMAVGDTLQLTATVLPENTMDKTVIWYSSDETVADVDENGFVTALTEGDVTITAVCQDIEESYLLKIIAQENVVESQIGANIVNASAGYGDGWGSWSDYVVESSVVVHPVDGGNLYFGHESYMSPEEQSTQIYLLSADSTITKAEIPACVDGLKVAVISTAAFNGCGVLERVSIPSSVEVLGDNIFVGCSSLIEIVCDEDNKIFYTEDGVLFQRNDTTGKSIVAYPAGRQDRAYIIPNGTIRIDPYAFSGALLRLLYIPESISQIGTSAVDECTKLESIYYAGSADQWDSVVGHLNCHAQGRYICFNKPAPDDGTVVFGDSFFDGIARPFAVGIQDIKVLAGDFYSFIVNKGFSEFANATLEEISGNEETKAVHFSFALYDTNQDNTDELIVRVHTEYPLSPILIFAATASGEIDFWGAIRTYWEDTGYCTECNLLMPDMSQTYVGLHIDETGIIVDNSVFHGDCCKAFYWLSENNMLSSLSQMEQNDWQKAYDTVLNEYREVCAMDADEFFKKYNVTDYPYINSDVIGDYHRYGSEDVVYTLYDVDGNAIKELLVGYGNETSAALIGLYAFDGEKAVTLMRATGQKNRMSIFEDGTICLQMDASWNNTISEYYCLDEFGYSLVVSKATEANAVKDFQWEILELQKETIQTEGKVYYYSEWDPESRTVTFGRDIVSMATVSDNADNSLIDSLNSLQGNYVIVEIKEQDGIDELVSILPVESIVGQVEYVSSIFASITIGGTEYPISSGDLVSNVRVDNYILCHIYDGEVIAVEILQELTGKLMGWNKNTREVSIALDNGPDLGALGYYLSNLASAESVEFLNKLSSGSTTIVTDVELIADKQGFVHLVFEYRPAFDKNPPYQGGEGTEPSDPETDEDKAESILISYRDDWEEAYNAFVEAVNSALLSFAGSDEEKREAVINKEADRMRKHDKSSSSKYISGNIQGYEKQAYNALATFFYDYATCEIPNLSSVDTSGAMAGVTIINRIMKNMTGESKVYEFGHVKVSITAMIAFTSKFGTMTITDTENKYSLQVPICSTQQECEDTLNTYVEELRDLATNSVYNVATSVYKDILGKPLSSLTSEYMTKTVTNLERKLGIVLSEKFQKAGVGQNLINTIDECYTFYTWVNKGINTGKNTDIEAAVNNIINLKFEDTTVPKGITKEAMKALKKAANKMNRAFNEYLEGTILQNEESFFRYLFNCPVEVSVYNSAGEQIGFVGEEDIWYTDAIVINEIGGAKEILSLHDEKLSFVVTATGYGTMSCCFEEFDDNFVPIGRLNYYDILLEPDKKFEITVPDNLTAQVETLAITSGSEKTYADEYISVAANGYITINCNAVAEDGTIGGLVRGSGAYVRGDAVVLYAAALEGFEFVGWFEGEHLVCVNKLYEFTAKENRNLTVKFFKNDFVYVDLDSAVGGTVIGEGRYHVGETATIIAAPHDGYSFGGWHVDGVCVSEENEYRFLVTEDTSLVAHFIKEANKISNRITVETVELAGQTSVWIDGKEYVVQQDGDTSYVDLPDSNAKTMVVYTYHIDDAADIHTQYPVSMKVWTLENEDGCYTATRQEAFDNILQYSGISIRVYGKKGIRMITSIERTKKDVLVSDGMASYTLKEYGTAIAWTSQLGDNKPLVLDKSYVRSNYAYKEGINDPIFKYTDDMMQYTNVLINFSNDQCKDDIAMRPYMILEHENGEQITLYGGIVNRSIGYIAYRNRNTYDPGTEEYEYVWEIIRHVYGNLYDDEYRTAWTDPIM